MLCKTERVLEGKRGMLVNLQKFDRATERIPVGSQSTVSLWHATALSFLTLHKGSIREGEKKAGGVCSCLPEGTIRVL